MATDVMDEYKLKYRQYLEKILLSVDASDPDGVAAAYDRLRAANERMLAGNPRFAESGRDAGLRRAVEEVIEEHSRPAAASGPLPQSGEGAVDDADAAAVAATDEAAGPAPAPAATIAAAMPARRGGLGLALAAFVLGLVLAGGAVAGLVRAGVFDLAFGAEASRKALWEAEYRRLLPQMEGVLAVLARVEEEVRRRQRESPAALAGLAGAKMVRLRDFDETLAGELPEGLPAGSNAMLRADETAYKIVMIGPLCRVAAIARPDRVDPKRPGDGLSCSHFGFWNEAGTDF